LRVRYVRNEFKEGLKKSLNKGIDCAKADYIARLDADDVALPDRLLLQYNFLKGSDCAVVGGSMVIIGEDGAVKGYRRYPREIKGKNMFVERFDSGPSGTVR